MISKRAEKLIKNPSAIMTGYKKWSQNPFNVDNPNGILNFGIAENHLMEDEILNLLNIKYQLNSKHIHYATLYGIEELRNSYSKFVKRYLDIDLAPEDIVTQTGVTSLCESLSFVLFDKEDEVLIPAPYYTGFQYDFEGRFNCKLIPVQLNQGEHQIGMFDKFITNKTKAILLTHPHNPTGEILTQEFLSYCIKLTKDNDLHLICDEVYALSRHDLSNKFTSVFNIKTDYQNIHHLYGVAKDLTLAGFKCGFFTSKNKDVLNAMKSVSYFHPVSTLTQIAISELLENNELINFFEKSANKISENLNFVKKNCPNLKIQEPKAGIFFIADLSYFLESDSFEAEINLYDILLNEYGINITPGQAMGLDRPGFFRVCYAKKETELNEFCKRINHLLITK